MRCIAPALAAAVVAACGISAATAAAPAPVAQCTVITSPVAHVHVVARDGWSVQSCVFDLRRHGRVVEQAGTALVGGRR